jgi:hypothetical protein
MASESAGFQVSFAQLLSSVLIAVVDGAAYTCYAVARVGSMHISALGVKTSHVPSTFQARPSSKHGRAFRGCLTINLMYGR